MRNKILNLKHLPQEDRINLLSWYDISYGYAQSKLSELTIFTKEYTLSEIDGFSYLHFENNRLFYLRAGKSHLGVFVDSQGLLVPHSRYYLSHLNSFVEFIDGLLGYLHNFNFSSFNTMLIEGEAIACEKWFNTYGHFHDECFNIARFIDLTSLNNTTILIDYSSDDEIDTTSFKFNKNYEILDKLLFKNSSVNAHEFKNNLILVNKFL
jgi:hypothetical protein